MQARTPFERWARWVLALAFALRLALALINMDAFDPHMPVVKAIAYEHRSPGLPDMWEGFQPKLWHTTVAMILRVVPTHHIKDITRIAQCVNVLAGTATLWLLFLFLRGLAISERTKLMAFSLIGLNPMMIGIDAQATNDSFVILFSTLTLYFGAQFFEEAEWRSFGFMTLGAVLAVFSKGNALVVVIAVLCTFVASTRLQSERWNIAWAARAAFFLAVIVTAMATLGTYRENWEKYGSPFATNAPADPVPAKFLSYVPSPNTPPVTEGVRTGAGWLFTFRIFDMLRWPHMHGESLFRTSMWSVLYGEWNFVHVDRWPYFWDDERAGLMWLGRALLLLALVPAAIFILSLSMQTVVAFRALLKRRVDRNATAQILLLVCVLGQFAFVAVYSYRGRGYEFAKAIFLFPALLGIVWIFAIGWERVLRWAGPRRQMILLGITGLLAAGYVADIVVLIIRQWQTVNKVFHA